MHRRWCTVFSPFFTVFTVFHHFHRFSLFFIAFIVFHCFSLFFIVFHRFSALIVTFSLIFIIFIVFHHCSFSLFIIVFHHFFIGFRPFSKVTPPTTKHTLIFTFFLTEKHLSRFGGRKPSVSSISNTQSSHMFIAQTWKSFCGIGGIYFPPLKNFPKNAESILTQFDRSKSGKLMAARSNRNSVVQVTWVWWNHKGCIVHSVNSHICIICWFWLCNKLNQNRFQSQNVRSEMENIFTARKIVFWLLSAGDHIVEISRIVII